MQTQHWRISLPKNGVRVVLYATTTDDTVARDLNGSQEESLICFARQYHRHGQTHAQNHRDLAIGALMAYATEPPFDRSDTHITRINTVPDRSPNAYVGGGSRSNLVPIWEEVEAEFGSDFSGSDDE
jgi:hypothetical protein